ncbi:MAG: TlpA family protein disulfide reductase [Firmicutes bacterium]|nr:TlpA family protein disulfide reductase [Bacillota bacterium]
MKKAIFWILLAALLVIIIVGASRMYQDLGEKYKPGGLVETSSVPDSSPSPEESSSELSPAPDFFVYDYDGNMVKLSDMIGKPVVLNFWASWCPPCKNEMPDFEEAYKEYGDDIHFMIVNNTDGSQETVETAKSYIDSQGYTFPVYYDTSYSAAITYGISSLPMTFFIDADGNLIAYGMGMLDASTLQRGIDMIYTPNEGE